MGPFPGWVYAFVRSVAILGVVVGVVVFLLTVTLGDCAAFGGRCPTEGVNDDVLGGAAFAGAMIGAGSVLAGRPSVRALRLAGITATAAAVLLAAVAHSMTST